MAAQRIIMLILGVLFVLLGLIFMIASADGNFLPRLAVGISMLLAGAYSIRKGVREPAAKQVFITRTLELSGDVSMEDLTCDKCGAGLSSENLSVKAGAVFVACPFCRTEYQIEEKPKW